MQAGTGGSGDRDLPGSGMDMAAEAPDDDPERAAIVRGWEAPVFNRDPQFGNRFDVSKDTVMSRSGPRARSDHELKALSQLEQDRPRRAGWLTRLGRRLRRR